MKFEDLLPALMVGSFVLLLVLERVAPARELPKQRFWLLKGWVFFFVVGAINAIVPAIAMERIGAASLFHLTNLGTWGGALVIVLLSDLVGYWIHRGLHSSERVWRYSHQLHHSAERFDMAGSAYFHPLDSLAQQVVPTVLILWITGVTPEAAAVGGFLGYLLGITPHLNMRTPVWLGFIFQRPEMHALHHQRGVHAHNYGVLAWSDLIFRTWHNPRTFTTSDFGFWDGASSRLTAMLLGQDVTKPQTDRPQAQRSATQPLTNRLST